MLLVPGKCPKFQVKLYARLAASRVLDRSMAMVIGPTPPGTGVMADATRTASS